MPDAGKSIEELLKYIQELEAKYQDLKEQYQKDIIENKRGEEAFHQEHTLLRTLIDNIPDSIYCKDLNCRKTLANHTDIQRLNAKSDEEVLGKDDFAFYPREIAEKFYSDDKMVMQTGKAVINREEYFLDENGQKRWLL